MISSEPLACGWWKTFNFWLQNTHITFSRIFNMMLVYIISFLGRIKISVHLYSQLFIFLVNSSSLIFKPIFFSWKSHWLYKTLPHMYHVLGIRVIHDWKYVDNIKNVNPRYLGQLLAEECQKLSLDLNLKPPLSEIILFSQLYFKCWHKSTLK